MLLRRSALLLWFTAFPLLGGYADTELWIPVVGRSEGAAGRQFLTTLFVTNNSEREAALTLSFFAAAQPGRPPLIRSVRLRPRQTITRTIDQPVGSLRITSTQPVVASARAFSRLSDAEVGAVIQAIPARFAIGSGESTLVHGSMPEGRYKLYAAETAGFPLYFSVSLEERNSSRSSARRLYLGAYEQRSWELAGSFAALRITGINGSGKIILAGTQIVNSTQDTSVYEMLLPAIPRHRIRWPEWLAYILVASALLAAAWLRWTRG